MARLGFLSTFAASHKRQLLRGQQSTRRGTPRAVYPAAGFKLLRPMEV
jgi:hypothetical protein